MMRRLILSLLLFFGSQSIHASELPPLADAVKIGNILYLSGQIGTIKLFQPPLVEGGIEAEFHQTMKNIQQVLENNGASLDQVFKCTIMMADMREMPIVNALYPSYFTKGKYPARTAFGVTALALNARVEIECMAQL